MVGLRYAGSIHNKSDSAPVFALFGTRGISPALLPKSSAVAIEAFEASTDLPRVISSSLD